jgi:hypothetical protein
MNKEKPLGNFTAKLNATKPRFLAYETDITAEAADRNTLKSVI